MEEGGEVTREIALEVDDELYPIPPLDPPVHSKYELAYLYLRALFTEHPLEQIKGVRTKKRLLSAPSARKTLNDGLKFRRQRSLYSLGNEKGCVACVDKFVNICIQFYNWFITCTRITEDGGSGIPIVMAMLSSLVLALFSYATRDTTDVSGLSEFWGWVLPSNSGGNSRRFLSEETMIKYGALMPEKIQASGFFSHVLINDNTRSVFYIILMLLTIGFFVERRFGTFRIAVLCIISMVSTGIAHCAFRDDDPLFGSESLILSLVGLFLVDIILSIKIITWPMPKAVIACTLSSLMLHERTRSSTRTPVEAWICGMCTGLFPGMIFIPRRNVIIGERSKKISSRVVLGFYMFVMIIMALQISY